MRAIGSMVDAVARIPARVQTKLLLAFLLQHGRRDHWRAAEMAGAMEACYVGDDRVRPQPGGFYGGWITSELVGPFKGEPGTGHW